ncbi:hypothetical protein J437_LFUL001452 [Ladona fulva]|uniref:Uncharacterized protein n=1 Tax=Ladona fulva TaxID=123851 RepID=A0A8K0JU34_LADFU|nr:hypothetical protein J437_LFUL001452 [Ladona fulva]
MPLTAAILGILSRPQHRGLRQQHSLVIQLRDTIKAAVTASKHLGVKLNRDTQITHQQTKLHTIKEVVTPHTTKAVTARTRLKVVMANKDIKQPHRMIRAAVISIPGMGNNSSSNPSNKRPHHMDSNKPAMVSRVEDMEIRVMGLHLHPVTMVVETQVEEEGEVVVEAEDISKHQSMLLISQFPFESFLFL